jgi:SAM-dependent methyltransferase
MLGAVTSDTHERGDGPGPAIGDEVRETWLETLAVNAAFDRPWVDAAVAWLVAAEAPALVVDVGSGAGGAAYAFAARLAAGDVGGGAAGGDARRGAAGGDAGRSAAGRDAPGTGAVGGARVVALDRDPRLVAVARRRAAGEGVARRVAFGTGEIGALPLAPGTADLVWASGVVHHVADQQAAVDELAALVRPGGTVVLVEGGLPLRCLPHEVGVGRPGLEARLDEARARWFVDLRDELGGPPLPYGWPEALARAGLVDVRARSFLAEAAPPLDEIGREVAAQHLGSALGELGDRLSAEDRDTVSRLADPADPAWIGHRRDLVVTAVRTVHAGRRPRP